MTSFTTLSITPLVCIAASKLNWTVYKTTETVNCKIVNKTLQWFQNKTSSHSRCSIKKGVLKNFAIFTAPDSLFNKVAGHTFSIEPLRVTASGIYYRNICTCENLKPNCLVWGY